MLRADVVIGAHNPALSLAGEEKEHSRYVSDFRKSGLTPEANQLPSVRPVPKRGVGHRHERWAGRGGRFGAVLMHVDEQR